MKPLVVVNPHSNGGKTAERASEILAMLRARLGEIDVVRTERSRHAVELAEAAAAEGRETVVAVGGDGTIHEIVNGLMRARASGHTVPRLGIIGQGTGGDLRKTLGLEHRLDRYLEAIASGRSRGIDVGRFSYVDHRNQPAEAYFVNILSMGMGGLVDQYVATLSRSLPGVLAYFAATARALAESRVGQLRCKLRTGEETREVQLRSRNLAICNGQYFGSGMHVAPMAVPDDGRFHIVSLPARGRLSFALSSLSIYSGKHIALPDVTVLSCEAIDIELDNPEARDRFLLDVDGEPMGKLPISVEVVPKAIEIFVGGR
jgi:diacylglycerol kinase (ATP)